MARNFKKVELDEQGQRNVVLNSICGNARVYAVTTLTMERQYKFMVMTREEIDRWKGQEDLFLLPVILDDEQKTTNGQWVDISALNIIDATAVSFTFNGRPSVDVVISLSKMGFRDPATFASGNGMSSIVYRLKKDGSGKKVLNNSQKSTIVLRRYFPQIRGMLSLVPVPRLKHGVSYLASPAQWTENNPEIIESIDSVCGLKPQKPSIWNWHDEFFPIPEHEVFKDWNKEQFGNIVRMTKDGNMVVFDVMTSQVGMWSMDFEKFITEKVLHPVTVPSPVRITEPNRPQRVLDIKDVLKTKRSRPQKSKIPTGIGFIDKTTGGIQTGGLSLVTGYSGDGKSTLASQILLNMVNNGYKAVLFSGEMDDTSVLDVIVNQSAGRDNLIKGTGEKSSWTCNPEIEERIAEWLDGRLGIYNNEYSFNIDEVLDVCREDCRKRGAHVLVLDNLMMLDCSQSRDELQKQKEIVLKLKKFATTTGLTVILVAHTRKTRGLLSIDDILGASEITKLCDDIIACYKSSRNFKKVYCEEYGEKGDEPDDFYSEKFGTATNVIAILKSRYSELRDTEYCGLWFEPGSKRLLDFAGQQIQYGWEMKKKPVVYSQSFVPLPVLDEDRNIINEMVKTSEGVKVEQNIEISERDPFLDLPDGDDA